nr:T9SS type B sorting domain-containing protein [uncultured Psychroserpens sp.]
MKRILFSLTFMWTLFVCNKSIALNTNNNIENTTISIDCPAPILTSFSPSNGPEQTLITITGSNFNDASTVTFDGINATFSIINDNEITALVPSGANPTSIISITSSGGCTGNSSTDFTLILSDCITTAEIYISEVYDSNGGSYGVFELYNPSNTTINLDGVYEIERYGDIGNPTPSATIPLAGSINPLDTFIIEMGSTGNTCSGLSPNITVAAGINADDEIRLLKNGVTIDIMYTDDEIGFSFIRNPDAVVPSNSFDITEWLLLEDEDCSNLDIHTADPIITPNITHPISQNACENGSATFSTSVDIGTYTYQWKTLDISGNWVNIINNANYSGATTNTLTINNIPASFDDNQYYCEITSTSCDLISNAAHLNIETPLVDTITNQTVCSEYTLPTLTNGNYFTATNGTGTQLNAGDNISATQTIFIYSEIGTPPNTCSNETSFTVTVSGTPPVDTLTNQTVCSEYTLPTLTNGNYFTETNGNGTALNTGDNISATQTIFIYSEIGTPQNTCSNETSFTVTVGGNPPVDTIANQTVCSEYTLPTLTNGNYFTETNGIGTQLNDGDNISATQTIFIYSEIGTPPNTCSNETSFTVTVGGNPPVDTIANQTVCSEYTLPTLTNGNYFTETNGNGTALNAGDNISATQTIFIYSEIGTPPNTCSNETSFTVTVGGNPPVDTITNQTVCSEYTLPTLTNGNYFTETNGNGTALNAGDNISATQTIFIYSEIGTPPNTCSNESSFTVTINQAIDFDLAESNLIIDEDTITVIMTDTSINYEYALDNLNFQNSNVFTNLIEGTHTLYVQDSNGCILKSITFEINRSLSIPLFFTPNDDGYKDFWKVIDHDNIVKEIFIFNRYGKLLKQLSPQSIGWSGIYNGNILETNDYWYLITLRNSKQLRGHFTLKR